MRSAEMSKERITSSGRKCNGSVSLCQNVNYCACATYWPHTYIRHPQCVRVCGTPTNLHLVIGNPARLFSEHEIVYNWTFPHNRDFNIDTRTRPDMYPDGLNHEYARECETLVSWYTDHTHGTVSDLWTVIGNVIETEVSQRNSKAISKFISNFM